HLQRCASWFVGTQITLHQILISAVGAHRQKTASEQPGPKRVCFREVNRQGETKRAVRKGRAKRVSGRPDSEIDEVELVMLLTESNSLTQTALNGHNQ